MAETRVTPGLQCAARLEPTRANVRFGEYAGAATERIAERPILDRPDGERVAAAIEPRFSRRDARFELERWLGASGRDERVFDTSTSRNA